MKYMGSKGRHAKELLKIILEHRTEGQTYVEPFVGGCNIIQHVTGERIGGDNHPYLIAMWKALLRGWLPPLNISEQLYKAMKADNGYFDPALVGFVGFGCSYAGKWFGGFARSKKGKVRNYTDESARHVLKQVPLLKGVEFCESSYDKLLFPPKSLIYCDPPYANTTKYTQGQFDSVAFWQWCDDKVSEGHTVFVSEYNAPDGWRCVWEKKVNNTLVQQTGSQQGTERLYVR